MCLCCRCYHHRTIMSTQYHEFHLNFMIFGRTDLRIGVSRPNFDAESDFEVRLAVASQKPNKNSEKLRFLFELKKKKSKIFVFVFRRFFSLLRSGEAETRATDRSRRPGFIFSLRSWPAQRKNFENLARTSVRRIGGAGLSPSTVQSR